MPRLRPPRDPVTLRFEGEPVLAERGEPAAVALIAAGHLALARSPKFHRPRGPACLRGACDGCLARVDDEPNVMTCRVPAAEGMRIEAQNVVGSKDTDLLRVADWFFPEGMNHHELFAGVPGLRQVLQGFARRVAGLGRLPGVVAPSRRAQRRALDALVVGAGPAGMAAATALAARGRKVEVVDDDLAYGGSARILLGAGDRAWAGVLDAFRAAVGAARVRVSQRTTAAGFYGGDVLLVSDRGRPEDGPIEVVETRTLVLAPGAHDAALAFEGNDVPGVLSARAACALLARGVTPGARVVVACVDGVGPFGRAYAAADSGATLVRGMPRRASGSARIKAITIATAEGDRRLPCDTLVIDAPGAPAYELSEQAGAELSHEPRGFVVRSGAGGRVREGVFAVGEVAGTPLEPEALAREARAMANAAHPPSR
jgi:NADPH-dependent 2,4-dienoyl-CoA reductase/sulfur reductase-like enzyme